MSRDRSHLTRGAGLAIWAAGLLCACSSQGPAAGGNAGPGKLSREATDPSEVAEMGAPLPGAGSRCQGGTCACRPIDEQGRGASVREDTEAEPPVPGTKRFELRTGRGDDTMKITVEGLGTFVKSGEAPEPGCVYVDLPPGPHRVRLHVTARRPQAGLEARLRVSEYSPQFRRWYRTFAFRCGNGSEPCSKDDARDTVATLAGAPGGRHDPCGSTRVQGLRFVADKPPDAPVGDFSLQLVLNVYKFAPRFPPDAPTCHGTSHTAESEAEKE